jgi:hypothetical protein
MYCGSTHRDAHTVTPSQGNEVVIQPPTDVSSQGSLLVETEEDKLQTIYDTVRRYPFYIHDQQGRLLDEIHNDIMTPITMPPGRYTVRSFAQGKFRCIQVTVEAGRTTLVSSRELEHAPPCD